MEHVLFALYEGRKQVQEEQEWISVRQVSFSTMNCPAELFYYSFGDNLRINM